MSAIIHGAGAATALSTFNSKKLVARSRTNLPGSNFDFYWSEGFARSKAVWVLMQGGARDALSLLDLMMGVRALALLASVFVTLTN